MGVGVYVEKNFNLIEKFLVCV